MKRRRTGIFPAAAQQKGIKMDTTDDMRLYDFMQWREQDAWERYCRHKREQLKELEHQLDTAYAFVPNGKVGAVYVARLFIPERLRGLPCSVRDNDTDNTRLGFHTGSEGPNIVVSGTPRQPGNYFICLTVAVGPEETVSRVYPFTIFP